MMNRFGIRTTATLLLLSLFALPVQVGATEESTDLLFLESFYHSYTGTVEEMRPTPDVEGGGDSAPTYVRLKRADDTLMGFVVDDATLLLNLPVVVLDQQLVAFYDGNLPIPPSDTPEVPAVALVPYVEEEHVVLSYFDADLVSSDGTLKLNIEDYTDITDASGAPYTGDVAGQVLLVLYGPATEDVPAETTPVDVVVMDLSSAAPTYVVNGSITEASAPYTQADGIVMVPLVSIAEALGLSVTEEGEDTYRVGRDAYLTLGEDSYTFRREAPIQLGSAPEEKNGEIYVPLAFFAEDSPVGTAYVLGGQIIIDNE